MTAYPMLHSLRELVEGKGFIAAIELDGAALIAEDAPGRWWASGVNPGAIAANGATIREAFAELAIGFKAYLHDCALDAPTFDAFRKEVERFFSETDAEGSKDWEEALSAVRAGVPLPRGVGKMPVAARPRGVRIREVVAPTPYQGEVWGDIAVAG